MVEQGSGLEVDWFCCALLSSQACCCKSTLWIRNGSIVLWSSLRNAFPEWLWWVWIALQEKRKQNLRVHSSYLYSVMFDRHLLNTYWVLIQYLSSGEGRFALLHCCVGTVGESAIRAGSQQSTVNSSGVCEHTQGWSGLPEEAWSWVWREDGASCVFLPCADLYAYNACLSLSIPIPISTSNLGVHHF